jgi:hypothetical protein
MGLQSRAAARNQPPSSKGGRVVVVRGSNEVVPVAEMCMISMVVIDAVVDLTERGADNTECADNAEVSRKSVNKRMIKNSCLFGSLEVG